VEEEQGKGRVNYNIRAVYKALKPRHEGAKV